MTTHTFTVGHLCGGSGFGARGFKAARARHGVHEARFECLGSVDFDEVANEDFRRLTGGRTLTADLHQLQPHQLRAFMGERAPDVMFSSPPCKAFSQLLSVEKSKTEEYQRMAGLFTRCLMLAVEAWPESPPGLLIFENVPAIESRGAELLRQAEAYLMARGYRFDRRIFDCGEIGGLAQRRRRFTLVARHAAKVPQEVHTPPLKRVRACGEVLGPLPLPNDPAAGPLHRLPEVSFLTWVRLASIRAGKDWRDLPRRGPVTPPREGRRGNFGVADWTRPVPTIRGRSDIQNATSAVADPSVLQQLLALERVKPAFNDTLSVRAWDEAAKAVTTGTAYTGDPRVAEKLALTHAREGRFADQYRVQRHDRPAATITGTTDVQAGAPIIADPKIAELLALGRTATAAESFCGRPGLLGVNDWKRPAPTVTAAGRVTGSNMPAAVADPIAERLGVDGSYRNTTLGVTPWSDPAPTVTGSAQVDNGAFSVGAPLPSPPFPPGYVLLTLAQAEALLLAGWQLPRGVVPVIIAPDGTWHRPLTLLELAVLQGLPPVWQGAPLTLAGGSRARIAEHIGNGLPVGTMKAIMGQMLRTLLAARVGQLFMDGTLDVWVDPWRDDEEHRLGAVLGG